MILNAQPTELIGKWILVRTLNNNNTRLDINNSDYSKKMIYQIDKNSFKINGQLFKPKFKENIINLSDKNYPEFTYTIKENYLITKEIKGHTTNYFLKVDDFIKRFPEFSLKEIDYNDRKVYLDNGISAYDFNHDLTYDFFILLNGNSNSDKRNIINPDSLPLQFEYILTVDNKIKDFKIINSENNLADNDYIERFKKASKYFKNTTDKDVLLRYTGVSITSYPELTNKDEKRLFEISAQIDRYYYKNEFINIIDLYDEFTKLKIKPNRFNKFKDDNYIRLGVSFLAQNRIDEACISFKNVGDITDFRVRNYLLDFCQK